MKTLMTVLAAVMSLQTLQAQAVEKIFTIECVSERNQHQGDRRNGRGGYQDYDRNDRGQVKLSFSTYKTDWYGREGQLISQYKHLPFQAWECESVKSKLQKFTNYGRPFHGEKSMKLCWLGNGGYRLIGIDVYFDGAINKVSEKVVPADRFGTSKQNCEDLANDYNRRFF